MATKQQFENYIDQLMNEIRQFPDDASLWKVPQGVSNSPGNLGLHIAGNLQHFIGAIMGKTGYVRQREIEFSTKGLSREDVLDQLLKAKSIVSTVLESYTSEKQTEPYPEEFKGRTVPVHEALAHLFAHVAYHTGQVNYLRRMLY